VRALRQECLLTISFRDYFNAKKDYVATQVGNPGAFR